MKTVKQTNAPKLAIIDNAVGFFSPVEAYAELQAWRAKTGFAVNVIRFLPSLKKRHIKVNVPANAPLAVRHPRSPLVAI